MKGGQLETRMARKRKTIMDTIKAEIDRRGLTQTELADRAGITQSKVSAYMSGKVIPRADTLDKIMAVLNLEVRAGR
mgnify:CR=1 FL=1